MRKSRLSWQKQERLIEFFVAGATARTAARLVQVNKTTGAFYFHRLREVIFKNTTHVVIPRIEAVKNNQLKNIFRQNYSGFSDSEELVFGLVQYNQLVYSVMLMDKPSLNECPVVYLEDDVDSIVCSSSLRPSRFDVKEFKQYRKITNNSRNKINQIENFWGQTKQRMLKHNGIPKEHFYLFLKESEWRFHYPDPMQQYQLLEQWVEKEMGKAV